MALLSIGNRIITVLFMMGNVLLLIFMLFSGTTDSFPINRFYWLQANTSSIPNAEFSTSTWTFWGLCAKGSNGRADCSSNQGKLSPGYPLSPYDNFGTTTNVPSDFVKNRGTYYYLSRFDFAFVWLALIFSGVNLLIYAFTFCSYSFIRVVWFLQVLATLFIMANAAVQTACVVMARNAFNHNGQNGEIGVCMMAMLWATCFMGIVLFFTTGGTFIKRAYKAHKEYVQMQKYKEDSEKYQQQVALANGPTNLGPGAPLYSNPPIVPMQSTKEPLQETEYSHQQQLHQEQPNGEGNYEFHQSYENVARPQSMIQSEHNAVLGNTTNANTTNANNTAAPSIRGTADIRSNVTHQTSNSNNKYGIKFFKVRRTQEEQTDEDSV
ncbi:hypothetical protein ACO0RG_003553 [Hanseniaspora osmophila]|mgnify:CR=1 FL=1|uniref:Protein SUR7 n=1 Tax=Hanseniaspora osmophila TaxID=56408 RepID=A0A1E5RFT3_9ASCO|nr:Protein SUR7 [Hanseniaspora osmophila]